MSVFECRLNTLTHLAAVEVVWRGEKHDHRQSRPHVLMAGLRESSTLCVRVKLDTANLQSLVGIAPLARLRAHARDEALLELAKVCAEVGAAVQV